MTINEKLINLEIARLESLGWKDLPLDRNGVRISPDLKLDRISFPKDSWSQSNAEKDNSSYWALHRVNFISKALLELGSPILWEVGAGNGNVATNLNRLGFPTISIEPLYDGAQAIAASGGTAFNSLLEGLNLPPNSIAAFGAFDVLEHLETPEKTLNQVFSHLVAGGSLLVTVPAHNWLFSDYDEAIGHYRRYSRRKIRSLLIEAGFEHVKITNLFGFLVIPALILRRLPYLAGRRRSKENIENNTKKSQSIAIFAKHLLNVPIAVERIITPFVGLSLFVTARKPV